MQKRSTLLMLSVLCMHNAFAAQPKVILLDLGGLFYKFSGMSYARKLGIGNLLSYVVRDFKNPHGLERVIFEVLSSVSEEDVRAHADEFKKSILYKKLQRASSKVELPQLLPTRTTSGKPLPYIINAYQAGYLSPEAAIELAVKAFEELKGRGYFASEREAYLIEHSIRLIFSPEVHASMNYELSEGVTLLHELAAQRDELGNKKFIIVALANIDKESARLLEERLRSRVHGYFQYIFYSGDLGTIKPNAEAFVLPFEEINKGEAFKNNPVKLEDAVFLDDQIENIMGAQQAGIHQVIHYSNAHQAREELVKLGVLAPKPERSSLKKVAVVAGAVVGAVVLAFQYW